MSTEPERRAPVQGTIYRSHAERLADAEPPGTISWAEHLEAYAAYAGHYGRYQTAERIAERGGFDHAELRTFLGRAPSTFIPRRR